MRIRKAYFEEPFPYLNEVINVKDMANVWYSVNVLLISAVTNSSKILVDCFWEVEADY